MMIRKSFTRPMMFLMALAVSVPAQAELVFYASFENDTVGATGGTLTDGSGKNNHGTYQGTTTVTDVGAQIGNNAGSLDSSGGILGDSGSSNALPTGDSAWSYSVWFQLPINDTSRGTFLGWGTNAGNQNTNSWYNASMPRLSTSHWLAPEVVFDAWGNGNPDIRDGNWHHVVGTYAGGGGTERLYVDGILMAELETRTALDLTIPSSIPWVIGATVGDGGSAEYVTGLVDDLAIWSSTLSEGQARAIYSLGLKLGQNDSAFGFNYGLDNVTQLFGAYDAMSSVTLDGHTWSYADNLTAPSGLNVGELFDHGGLTYLLLDAGAGTGMVVPEPGTWMLLLAALVSLLAVRRRRK